MRLPAPGLEQVGPLPASWAQMEEHLGFGPAGLGFRGWPDLPPLMEFKYLSDGHSHAKWLIPEHLLHLTEALSTLPFTWVFPEVRN